MTRSEWQDLYKAALLELDPNLLPNRIDVARNAIHSRLKDEHESITKAELEEIESALRMLSYLLKQAA